MNSETRELATAADTFSINARNLVYMIKLIDRYGLETVKEEENLLSSEIKQEMIDKSYEEFSIRKSFS